MKLRGSKSKWDLRGAVYRYALAAAIAGASAGCTSGNAPSRAEPVARTGAALTLSQTASTLSGLDGDWYTADIDPISGYSGSATYSASTFELRSEGFGPGIGTVSPTASDSLQFVYTPRTGDVEIVVRIVSAGPSGRVHAGVMLREGINPTDRMGSGWFSPDFDPSTAHCSYSPTTGISTLEASTRFQLPDTTNEMGPYVLGGTRTALPVWLRLRRVGHDYAVWRRREGGPWLPLYGGEFIPNTGLVGFFASRMWNDAGSPEAVVDFDNVYVGPIRSDDGTESMKTSWIGSSDVALSTGYVTPGLRGFYVSPNGVSYKYAHDDEQGGNINLFDTSGTLQKLGASANNAFIGVLQGGITGDGSHVFIAKTDISVLPRPLYIERHTEGSFAVELTGPNLGGGHTGDTERRIGGLATGGGKLYVSDYENELIRVLDATTLADLSPAVTYSLGYHPGAIALDHSQRLWIAKTADNATWATGTLYQNSNTTITCLQLPGGGTCTGTADITGIDNPVALAISPNPTDPSTADPADDELLVTTNGADQNVLVYGLGSNPPAALTPIGTTGGVFASPAGIVSSGTSPRFYRPVGAGVDKDGNVYVASSELGMDIRKFSSGLTQQWARLGLAQEPGAFDPGSNGQDFYTLTRHFTFDPSQTTPGSEWGLKAVSWDPFLHVNDPLDPRTGGGFAVSSAPWIRTVGTAKLMFVWADPNLTILRFDGEISKPYGSVTPCLTGACDNVWIDANGNGTQDSGETTQVSASGNGAFDPSVDSAGHVWVTLLGGGILDLGPTFPTDSAHPAYGQSVNTYATPAPFTGSFRPVAMYDRSLDALFMAGGESLGLTDPPQCAMGCPCGAPSPVITRYDGWSSYAGTTSTPAPTWTVDLPDPRRSLLEDDDMGALSSDPACGCLDWGYLSFVEAGDFVFLQERHGIVHVQRKSNGQNAALLYAGPEVSSYQNWTDHALLSVVERSNGEYLLTTMDSSNEARNLVFRWTPAPAGPADFDPAAWYVASPNDMTLSSSLVARWWDRSGHGRDVVQTNFYVQPTFHPTGWASSQPTITFGPASLLQKATWTDSPAGTDQALTVLATLRMSSVTSSQQGIAAWWTDDWPNILFCRLSPTGTDARPDLLRIDAWNNNEEVTSTQDLGTTTPHVVAWRITPGSMTDSYDVFVDGVKTSQTHAALGNVNVDTFVVGVTSPLPTDFFNGDLSELVVVNRSLTDTEVAAYRTYAKQTWSGLP